MKKIIFIADFFLKQLTGGAEINDDTLISMFVEESMLFEKKQSQNLTREYIIKNQDKLFVISNMVNIDRSLLPILGVCDYVIYEHDYKFVSNRNPALYVDFVVPKDEIINENFYRNAISVICLSKMHREIFEKNLTLNNLTNINCSLFSDSKIDMLLELGNSEKTKDYAVINTPNPTKRTADIVRWCKSRNIKYDLISHPDNDEFLKILSQYKNLIFMTKHPEPTPRIAVESRLMGVNFISSKKMISVAHEDWWIMSPSEISLELKSIRKKALNIFKELTK